MADRQGSTAQRPPQATPSGVTPGRWVAAGGVVAGLTVAATIFTRVPAPGSGGQYFNLSEAVLYTAALVGGPWLGACAALGAALADLLVGAALWAPFTLGIKGVEALVAGHLRARLARGRPHGGGWQQDLLALVPAGIWMMAAYALAARLLGGPGAVPVELTIDAAQVSSSVVLALVLAPAVRRARQGLASRRAGGAQLRPD